MDQDFSFLWKKCERNFLTRKEVFNDQWVNETMFQTFSMENGMYLPFKKPFLIFLQP